MKFDPKSILAKLGWAEGQGLGKNNQGNKNPIKVTYKFDKTGLGHDFGKQYDVHSTFSLSFDNAVQKLKVVPTEDGGVRLESACEVPKQKTNQPKGVGNFVKSARLNNGELAKSKESDSESSDSDSELNAVPAIARMTDEELFQICGGLRGHRAGKFGINSSAKLARIKEQDELVAKSFVNGQKAVGKIDSTSNPDEAQAAQMNSDFEFLPKKAKKNKKSKHSDLNEEATCDGNLTVKVDLAVSSCEDHKTINKEKTSKNAGISCAIVDEISEKNGVPKKKKSKKSEDHIECIENENIKMEKSKKKKRNHHETEFSVDESLPKRRKISSKSESQDKTGVKKKDYEQAEEIEEKVVPKKRKNSLKTDSLVSNEESNKSASKIDVCLDANEVRQKKKRKKVKIDS